MTKKDVYFKLVSIFYLQVNIYDNDVTQKTYILAEL